MKRKFKAIIFTYIGKRYTDLTLDEMSFFYTSLGNLMNSMGIDENDHYRWLKTKGINERLKECERWLEGNYTGIENPCHKGVS